MRKFVAWLVLQAGLFVACLINGAFALWLVNPAFGLHVGYWGWVGVAFVVTEVVATGARLQTVLE